MSLWQTIRIALRALWSNKLRTGLAVLGIVFGVAAVTAIMSFGETFKGTIAGEVNKMGAGILLVQSGEGTFVNGPPPNTVTLEDVDLLAATLPVEKSSPLIQTSLPLMVNGQPKFHITLGFNEHFEDLRNWHVGEGRFFSGQEVAEKRKVVVIGSTLRDTLFGKDAGAIGKKVTFQGDEMEVVGVLKPYTMNMGADVNNIAVYPITYLAEKLNQKQVFGAMLRFKEPRDAGKFKPEVEKLLEQRHGVKDFSVQTQEEMLATFGSILDYVTIFIGAVAAIGLLVGGIGIMNIMLVSVKERTREIGIRKAIGAKRRHILLQFLVEACTLTFSGGLIGILVGLGMAMAGAVVMEWTFVASLPAVVLGFTFSTAIGIFFGLYPAFTASRLPAVEALRYE